MGLRDKYAKKIEEQGFRPIDLNEANVQAIFDRCLATTRENLSPMILFSVMYGYKPEDEILIQFDKKILLENKKAIEYLYGQLKESHANWHSCDSKIKRVAMEDFSASYTGNTWTKDKGVLIKLLYLGCNQELLLLKPFYKKYNGTDISTDIKPTLSPKDPAFPVWWEAHRGEWED